MSTEYCPNCISGDIEYLGMEDGGGDYGDEVCEAYHCQACGFDFQGDCIDDDESDHDGIDDFYSNPTAGG